MYLGIEAHIPVQQDLMEKSRIEFHPYNQSTDNVFASFWNITPAYTLPHAVIINQINKRGKRNTY